MNGLPKVKVSLTRIDICVEILGWIALVGIWILIGVHYTQLPDTIPTHYNASGVADSFGNKKNILTLPIVATFLFLGVTLLNKYPHNFNYLEEITPKNALQQYTNATRMLRVLKLVIVIVFGFIAYKTIGHANGNSQGLGTWFLPFTLALIFIPIFYFLIKANK